MEWVSLAIGVIGALPVAYIMAELLRGGLGGRRVLGLREHNGIEIVVTTSSSGISQVGPLNESQRAARDLLPAGDMAGVGEVCGLIGRVYPRKDFAITASARKQQDRERDLILIGGPVHNRYAAALICSDMNAKHESTDIVFDAMNRYIRFGGIEIGPNIDLGFEGNIPTREYALIVLSGIRRRGTVQRVISVAGLTTYGTGAGCDFLAHGLAKYARRTRLGKRPGVCLLVRANLVGGQPYDIDVIGHIPVQQLGVWDGELASEPPPNRGDMRHK